MSGPPVGPARLAVPLRTLSLGGLHDGTKVPSDLWTCHEQLQNAVSETAAGIDLAHGPALWGEPGGGILSLPCECPSIREAQLGLEEPRSRWPVHVAGQLGLTPGQHTSL